MRVDGNQEQRLITNPEWTENPQWSPDGQWIIFTSPRDNNYEIYRIRPDGSQQQNLTTRPESDVRALWSPDGQWMDPLSFKSSH
jgi:Tol biopolymer transport system component